MPTYRNSNRINSLSLPSGRVIGPLEVFEAAEGEVPASWLELAVEAPETNGERAMVELVSEGTA
jgi:hypothetical protein